MSPSGSAGENMFTAGDRPEGTSCHARTVQDDNFLFDYQRLKGYKGISADLSEQLAGA